MKIPMPLQLLLGTIATFFIMKLTAEGFQKNNIDSLFQIRGKTQTDRQIALMSVYALHFALFVIIMKILEWIFSLFKMTAYVSTTQRIVKNSFDYFIILGLIMFYSMRNSTKNKKQTQKKIVLYAFWFILGRILFATGFLLTTLLSKFNINGKVIGVALIYAEVTMLLFDICGYDSFQAFTIISPMGEDL